LANRTLSSEELAQANVLLNDIRSKLDSLAQNDSDLRFAYRRKIYKELSYDERGKPSSRKSLKMLKWGLQNRSCAHCSQEMPLKYSELDRKNAAVGYTEENTELVHAACHHARQAAKGYA
jgi:hypothetical protein